MAAPKNYLAFSDFAARVGITTGTLHRYDADGRLPEPDVTIGLGRRVTRGWSTETIDAWQANRPGRGSRTDLTG